MPNRSKIEDDGEFRRWIQEGKTYAWIVAEYARKYNVEISISMVSEYRRRHGLDRRIPRDVELVPWFVRPEHEQGVDLMMLRYEARRRGGFDMTDNATKRLESWKSKLAASGEVVHYDPDTDEGWWHVPRRPDLDHDLIREPDPGVRRRVATD